MRVALLLNVLFTIIEFIGGLYANSVAILSDAIHDLGDSIAIGAALLLEKQSGQGRTNTFSYGKRRFSTLCSLPHLFNINSWFHRYPPLEGHAEQCFGAPAVRATGGILAEPQAGRAVPMGWLFSPDYTEALKVTS